MNGGEKQNLNEIKINKKTMDTFFITYLFFESIFTLSSFSRPSKISLKDLPIFSSFAKHAIETSKLHGSVGSVVAWVNGRRGFIKFWHGSK